MEVPTWLNATWQSLAGPRHESYHLLMSVESIALATSSQSSSERISVSDLHPRIFLLRPRLARSEAVPSAAKELCSIPPVAGRGLSYYTLLCKVTDHRLRETFQKPAAPAAAVCHLTYHLTRTRARTTYTAYSSNFTGPDSKQPSAMRFERQRGSGGAFIGRLTRKAVRLLLRRKPRIGDPNGLKPYHNLRATF